MTPLTISEQVERIARIIDPHPFDAGFAPERGAVQNDIDKAADEAREKARAILALASPPEPTAGGGWKLVPVEPTAAMYLAGWRQANKEGPNVLGVITDTAAGQIYRAMLAASEEQTNGQ